MNINYNSEQDEKIKKEWQNFNEGKPINRNILSPEIYHSWIRSYKNGVDCRDIYKKVLPMDVVQERRDNNSLMCEVALPFMEEIYEVIKGSDSMVLLTDKDGYALKIIKDNNMTAPAEKNRFIEGANRSEDVVGTNAIGTCIYLDKPMKVWGQEHYAYQNKHWACVAAPIHNKDGILIGAINISNSIEAAHKHSLGMVISAAKAIENEISLRDAFTNIEKINERLTATLELIPHGIIVLNKKHKIMDMNEASKKMLHLDGDVVGKHIEDVLDDKDNKLSLVLDQEVGDREITLTTSKGNRTYYISTKMFGAAGSKHEGEEVLITIKEFEHVRKLVNKVSSAHSRYSFQDILGSSKPHLDTIGLAKIAAKSSSTVLITGESGTGKELFAQSIHDGSTRSDGPFISINCGALPKGLIESELFGYEGGAFTGAKKNGQLGKFELAHGGTLFLDEIGEMPLDVQVSILRTLQTREVTRIGGSKTDYVDVRIIAATNKNLAEAISDKTFREDLYYRLNVLRIHIPPLRNRKSDIVELTNHFLNIYSKYLGRGQLSLEEETYRILERYNWPGNVRELENVIERAANMAETSEIKSSDINRSISNSYTMSRELCHVDFMACGNIGTQYESSFAMPGMEGLGNRIAIGDSNNKIKDVERNLILRVLEEQRGSIVRTAEELGMGRRTLYRKCDEYDINYQAFRKEAVYSK